MNMGINIKIISAELKYEKQKNSIILHQMNYEENYEFFTPECYIKDIYRHIYVYYYSC